jgi:hypothetical protein
MNISKETKILYVGSFYGPSNAWRRKERLKAMGYTVVEMNTSNLGMVEWEIVRRCIIRFCKPLFIWILESTLLRTVRQEQPQLIIFEKSQWLRPSGIQKLREAGPEGFVLAHYNPDEFFHSGNPNKWGYFLEAIPCYDVHFVPKPLNVKDYEGMQCGRLHETLPAQPVTMYALAKNTLREYLERLPKSDEVSINWVRIFYPYGPGQRKGGLLTQLELAVARGDASFPMSGGEQLRDFVPVEQVAELIGKASLQRAVSGIVNCCSGVPISVRTFVEKRLEAMNATLRLDLGHYPYPPYEPMAFWGDRTKQEAILHDA